VSGPTPPELVVLIDEELVGERGNVKITWLVEHNDGFVPASQSPGARSERLDAGPGVVWRSRVEVALERGTSVVRVETRPNATRGTTLEHLTGSAKTKRPRVVRTRYVVEPRGRLSPQTEKFRPTK
jgi:hypothetical protein